MKALFARFTATFWRACCALLAIAAVASVVGIAQLPWLSALIRPWTRAAYDALGIGVTSIAFVGLVRLVLRAPPGSARDPARFLARVLAPYRRLVVATLAAATCASAALALGHTALGDLHVATFLLGFLANRARHLTWFAGRRDLSQGRIRFAARRRTGPAMTFFIGGLLYLGGLAMLSVIHAAALPLTALLVLGWFAWAVPLRYVTVGRDGVHVAGWRESFHRFGGEAGIEAYGHALSIWPVRGAKATSLRYAASSDAERAALFQRLRETADGSRRLEARDDSAPANLEATLAILDAAGGYRAAQLPRDVLWRIVEAPNVNVRVRLRAAELVAQEPEDEDLSRLQQIADDVAEPGTADALARIAVPRSEGRLR